ncbi:hypothetical protein RRV45_07900 [Bacillus sp. DTU_2020_1000418_1_SI_GHA_SEK_038]|uniref:hypothetical protein n=1 Tax=Bacillus sp. DTU_2020_1000418_1_SI_GHA_SEK_038 TaxID=3077585 RepID=UPI0028F04282|nr:hypothetical protein [Bacillus sp. DTU_2020_1000418_1_SI_GHA_SEK_038]WNS76898.1 hypothetical protein RRV45_07900 [Bacillus sp. DTU_2020_1000418_1_SI_GHA_SEK_038]
MGYIIPVNHYQYSQYAEREVIKRYDPYRFVPIKRIKPSINPPERQHPQEPTLTQTNKKMSRMNQKVSHQKMDRLYGEITGKGLLYSDFA